MFIADAVINLLPNQELKQILSANKEAYLVGANYPDSGYIAGTHYGEVSHWDPFIYAFADYIREKYQPIAFKNPKLVAFLFGCAVHRLSDEIMHWTFYPVAAKQDLKSDDWTTFHSYGDVGIDLLITIDRNLWLTHPASWWIPIKDLVEIYRRLGDVFTADEIIWGNSVIYFAALTERLIAIPAYPILKLKIPWAAQHYYDWPDGGILNNENKTVAYLMNLWQYLNGDCSPKTSLANKKFSYRMDDAQINQLTDFSEKAIRSGLIKINIIKNEDGSVILQSLEPLTVKFNQAIIQFTNKVIDESIKMRFVTEK